MPKNSVIKINCIQEKNEDTLKNIKWDGTVNNIRKFSELSQKNTIVNMTEWEKDSLWKVR